MIKDHLVAVRPAANARGMTAYKSGDPTTLNRLYGRAKGKPCARGNRI